jgi:uncharacterized membrane protein YgcG
MLDDVDPLAAATPSTAQRALLRRFRTTTVGGLGTPLITEHPEAAVELVMEFVTMVIEAKNRELARASRTARPMRGGGGAGSTSPGGGGGGQGGGSSCGGSGRFGLVQLT